MPLDPTTDACEPLDECARRWRKYVHAFNAARALTGTRQQMAWRDAKIWLRAYECAVEREVDRRMALLPKGCLAVVVSR